eukprot:TRINITY_DN12473_c0_g1_i2.p1 TRINITY_DN12473_c0_g1~~TRINITY_DN12473_c0_g1_i2.p1  ORF type:complete len:383 (+),score=60.88 TRINITY_DN12473_c0_g1_i2:113-1261(+)
MCSSLLVKTSTALATWTSLVSVSIGAELPRSKEALKIMDRAFAQCQPWTDLECFHSTLEPLFTKQFTYDFVYPYNKTYGSWAWIKGEHTWFNQAFGGYSGYGTISAGSDVTNTAVAYMLANWTGPFAGVPPPPGPAPVVRIRDLDFYAFTGTRVSYNWCMVDVVDILQQGGYKVLPETALPDLGYPAPTGQQGLPAPDSQWVNVADTAASIMPFERMIEEDLGALLTDARWWAEDMIWYGPAGIGTAQNRTQYVEHVLKPLRAAFTETRAEIEQLVCEGTICGSLVHLWGNHTGSWLGEKATGKLVRLRFGIHARVRLHADVEGCGPCGQLIEGWAQLDIPAAFAMMGVDLLARAQKQAAAAAIAATPAKGSSELTGLSLHV